ncbi:MAG: hypothetical protein IPJ18_18580 [Betaproteobacteria bacterium]|nr:hypothetical protein [Betaproteobacteria bacterium]
MAADEKLIKDLLSQSFPPGDAADTAAAAYYAFAYKQTWNYAQHNMASVPSDGGDPFTGLPWSGIDPNANTAFNAARGGFARRDPLVLDLDGDGIEAVGIDPAHPILFDHDGDGVKNATGWIKADDGLVVLDRNGNAVIDSGAELFGDSTILANGLRAGKLASNGFEALGDLDFNQDGAINSTDAAYTQLRIWQDANQDGVSQASELQTLSAAAWPASTPPPPKPTCQQRQPAKLDR